VGQDIIEITGKITNNGDRQLQQVEINCVFYDAYSQLVLRERVAIVRARDGGLAPGGTKNFRLAFDNIPASWNQNMPQLVIANIQF
ncbi:MAG: FxLYD domain-containing protein, partial [Bryobacteraceae bacterium]|nr:FxLYD domain-containing protein [Bryobacteraceae bacterium]